MITTKSYKLKDICIEITDGSHFSPMASKTGFPMFSVKDMREFGFSYDSCKYISKNDFDKMKKSGCVPQKDDILVAKDGSYLKEIFKCKETKEEAVLSSIAIFRPNKEIVDSSFLCYLLKTPNIYTFIKENCVSGSALPRIILKAFKEVKVEIPSLDTQRKIAAILSTIDDKIEHNNRMNDNLEKQVQTIFKNWFIDYEPFSSKLPSDWKNEKLGNVCKCLLGGTPSRKKDKYWNGDIPWINSGEVNNFRILKASEYITKDGLDNSSTKLLPKKTVVLAITGATLGQISMTEIETCANQSVIGVVPNDRVKYAFLYPLLVNKIPVLLSSQTGGAQQHINNENVKDLDVIIPSADILNKYCSIAEPILENISNNCFENKRLAELRDTLLPKLMSGEIDVSKVEVD